MSHHWIRDSASGGARRWIVVLTAVLVACQGPAPPAASEGVSRELARFRRATVDSLRYDVRLSAPADADAPVRGRTTVTFRRDDPEGRAVVLDFLAPEERVTSVRVNGRTVSPRFSADHLVLPGSAFPNRGEVAIELAFRAGDEALNRTDRFLYALFVPDRAHFSLPVFDQPDLKARFALTLEVPSGWEAIANGAVVEERQAERSSTAGGDPDEEGDSAEDARSAEADGSGRAGGAGSRPHAEGTEDAGRRVLRFAETEPLPTYLFAFAAGDFQVERADRAGRGLTFFHRETDSADVARNLDAIFDLHGTALEWLEDYTDVDYPFGAFGFIAIPSFQYGGMEHPGAVYYRASSLFLDESSTQSQELGRASLIAHETAHMWFGDLVTMEWFDDVWMKEVFANFMAARIVHPSFPDLDHDLREILSKVVDWDDQAAALSVLS